jgi:hypothetical protein
MTVVDTDYFVVGAGAAGMAFADALIADSDADVVLVDRRYEPGGHWNDAYSFVRLHQPSASYGVNSRVLGRDSIDEFGPNGGLYERATATEICAYFRAVLHEHLLPSGRVRFLPMCDYLGDWKHRHELRSRTGEVIEVRARRKVVDATYLETLVPATHTPSFTVDPGVRMISVNDLIHVDDPGSGFTIIGGGKTALDACLWLLDLGVDPETIRWIRPRDAWLLDRAFQQPLGLVDWLIEGVSLTLEAAASADSVEDLFHRLEACGQLIRLDRSVEPTMYRCATVSTEELTRLRQIENVVRQGRVVRITPERIVFDHGAVSTNRNQVHVDCSAAGLRKATARPIFEPGLITLQQVRTCQPTFNAALVAYLEASGRSDEERNRLCPPNPYPTTALDWIPTTAPSAPRRVGARVRCHGLDGALSAKCVTRGRQSGRRAANEVGCGTSQGLPRARDDEAKGAPITHRRPPISADLGRADPAICGSGSGPA